MTRTLIRRAVLAVAVTGALATVAAAPSRAAGPSTSPPVSQVIVQDVRVPVPGQRPVPAYLVRSAGTLRARSHAGILFLHWLGQIHSDRTEFLAEATQLAPRGAVSLLPQGVFPWQVGPVGTPHDVTAIKKQLAVFQACLNWLISRNYVSRSRIAVVGHDYGAMYATLLTSADRRVHTAVFATPDATWAIGSSSTGWASPESVRHGMTHRSPGFSRCGTFRGWAATSCSSGPDATSSSAPVCASSSPLLRRWPGLTSIPRPITS